MLRVEECKLETGERPVRRPAGGVQIATCGGVFAAESARGRLGKANSQRGHIGQRPANTGGVEIDVNVGPGLDDVVLDPIRIREVMANLVVNALHAMPDGGTLTVEAVRQESALTVEVADSGVGIAPEDIDLVFDRFRKGSTSTGQSWDSVPMIRSSHAV